MGNLQDNTQSPCGIPRPPYSTRVNAYQAYELRHAFQTMHGYKHYFAISLGKPGK